MEVFYSQKPHLAALLDNAQRASRSEHKCCQWGEGDALSSSIRSRIMDAANPTRPFQAVLVRQPQSASAASRHSQPVPDLHADL